MADFQRTLVGTVDEMDPQQRRKAELCVDCVHYTDVHTHGDAPDKAVAALCTAALYRDPVTGDLWQLHARDWRILRTKPTNDRLDACKDFERIGD